MTPEQRHGETDGKAAAERGAGSGSGGGSRRGQDAPEVSDERLDAWILARLETVGVDLSVLPEDDPDAPADRKRIMESARRFLRTTPPAILGYPMDVQAVPPAMYPAELTGRTSVGGDGAEG
ncbi:MAG: hypothetical protein PVI57_12475 [Gemmatimonadota bacterium]|jgi:hypothetical protein